MSDRRTRLDPSFAPTTRLSGAAILAVLLCALMMVLLTGCGESDNPGGGENAEVPLVPGADPNRPVVVRPATLPQVPPAPKPTGPLPEGASCVTPECHATMARSAYIHGPVSQQACDTCHGPDTGTHSFPLARTGNEMCLRCHAVAGTAPHQHKALEQGCVTCHSPHASATKFLLKADSVEQLCAACHDTPLKQYAHDPFARGQCTLCHQPHQADNAMLLRAGEGSRQCYTCHQELRKVMASSAVVHEPARDDCITCHHPHASDHPHELRQPVAQTCLSCHTDVQQQMESAKHPHAAMTEGDSCVNCHDPHFAQHRQLLGDRMDRTCLTCHDRELKTRGGRTVANMKPVLTESKFLHGPARSGDCSACHMAHGGDHAALLTRSFPSRFYASFDVKQYELCFGCHDSALVLTESTGNLTNFRDGDRNLHYVHVNRSDKGRTCKTCHDVHGSDLPNHMASAVPFEGSNWSMAIRYEKTREGGGCTPDCHGPKTYRRDATAQQAMTPQTITRGGP